MDYTQMKLAESSDNSTGGNFFTTGRGTNQETPPNAGGESGLNPLDFPKTGTSSPPYEGPSEKAQSSPRCHRKSSRQIRQTLLRHIQKKTRQR